LNHGTVAGLNVICIADIKEFSGPEQNWGAVRLSNTVPLAWPLAKRSGTCDNLLTQEGFVRLRLI